jgi:hypothetical protein
MIVSEYHTPSYTRPMHDEQRTGINTDSGVRNKGGMGE